MSYILLIVNVFIMASGQLFFKKSADFMNEHQGLAFPMNYITNPWFYGAISLFIISTFVWTQVLTKLPLSFAYPIMSCAYILTVLGAFAMFQEKITAFDIVGVLLIMVGVTITAIK